MFRKMRRARQQLDAADCVRILKSAEYGVLAVSGDDGYPYAVPLNYVYTDGRIYFHCAKSGHKLDAIRSSDKVSFCAVGTGSLAPERFATDYESVIAFGRASVVEDEAELLAAIRLLMKELAPEHTQQEYEAELSAYRSALCILRLDIEHMTAKRSLRAE